MKGLPAKKAIFIMYADERAEHCGHHGKRQQGVSIAQHAVLLFGHALRQWLGISAGIVHSVVSFQKVRLVTLVKLKP